MSWSNFSALQVSPSKPAVTLSEGPAPLLGAVDLCPGNATGSNGNAENSREFDTFSCRILIQLQDRYSDTKNKTKTT